MMKKVYIFDKVTMGRFIDKKTHGKIRKFKNYTAKSQPTTKSIESNEKSKNVDFTKATKKN